MDPLWILLIGMALVVGSILMLRLHPFLALLMGALAVASLTSPRALEQWAERNPAKTPLPASAADRVAEQFGQTVGNIGILIALAAIIGKCLLDSGAADRIVRSALKVCGENRAPAAFLGSGFLLGIPVFFDTVFYLLIPLAKASGLRRPGAYGFYVMAIIAGGTMTHSLVPPTPGPLFTAAALHVNLGVMMIAGLAVGAVTSTVGYAYARWLNGRAPVPLRDSAEFRLSELQTTAACADSDLPPLWLAVLPILLPVVLISADALVLPSSEAGLPRWLLGLSRTLGEKNIALLIAAGIALMTLLWSRRRKGLKLSDEIAQALASGGVIILITAAGGAFGGVLQQTGIGFRIESLAAQHQLAVLPLAFFLTALIRTAQGSATVAMITAVGIVSGMADPIKLGFHPVYLALAIGCGSKPFSWMNDSGFWVVCKMSGMTEAETIKSFSVLTSIMGLAGLAVILLAARFLPLT